MKKVLFASAAAIAFGVVAQAQAADPITLSIGGDATEWAGYVTNKQGANYNLDGSTPSSQALHVVSEQDAININFAGKTKLDNGLTVAVEVDTNGSQT